MSFIDLTVFFVYSLAVIIFGSSFYFKSKSAESYTTGGGNLPAWAVGMSIFATFVSSISFLALPGNAYQGNWNGFVFSLSIPIAAFMAVKFFVPLYRKVNSPSAYAFLEERFGPWARTYASACYLLTQVARMGTILYLLALPMNALFGWNIGMIIVVTGLGVLVYSLLGGIQAVIWTDAVQGIVLITGAVVCLLVLLYAMPKGPSQMFDIANEYNKFSLGSFKFNFSESSFWVILIYGLFINIQNYGIDQNYVQRYKTTKTLGEAQRSTLFGGLLYIPVSLLFFLIGSALFAYYKVKIDALPVELRTMDMADRIFPHFIVNELPQGVTGLLIASIFAAGMSTISTSLNSTATVIYTDYYQRYFQKAEKQSPMGVLYLSTIIMGVFGVVTALAMTGVKSALDAWWALSSIFSGGMLGLFLLAYFSHKVRNIDAAIGVIIGVIVIAWISLSPVYFTEGNWITFKSTLHTNMAIVMGTTAIFLTGFLLYNLFGREKMAK